MFRIRVIVGQISETHIANYTVLCHDYTSRKWQIIKDRSRPDHGNPVRNKYPHVV